MLELQEIAAVATIAAAAIGYLSLKATNKTNKSTEENKKEAAKQRQIDTSNVLNMTLDFSQEQGIVLLADCWIYNHGKEPITITKVTIDGTIRSHSQDSTAKIGHFDSIKKPTSIAAHDELNLALSFNAYKDVKMVKDVHVVITYLDANNKKIEATIEPTVDRVKLL